MLQSPQQNPWKLLGRKTVFENPFFQVNDERVINPAGKETSYGKIHFKKYAIGIITLDEQNHTILVGQFRYGQDQYSWEIVEGGGPIENNDPLSDAKRELREEAGLEAGEWRELLRMHTSNSVTDELAIIYLARDLSKVEMEHEETEVLDIQPVAFDVALDMVIQGEITDSLSVAAILKLNYLLEKNLL